VKTVGIDFTKAPYFLKIFADMGIGEEERTSVQFSIEWEETDGGLAERLYSNKGIDIDISELEVADDSTLEYKGRKVLVYIRDQRANRYGEKKEYRYHISDCDTLQKMKRGKRYDSRYVVTNNRTGVFEVNIEGIEQEEELKVCKNCLRELAYNNYINSHDPNSLKVFNNFSLDEFFSRYDTSIKRLPIHTVKTAPIDKYADDHDQIALRYKQGQGWKCEQCKRDFSKDKKYLHAHHINGHRADNWSSNLMALCICCHSKQPKHEHMRRLPDFTSFVLKYGPCDRK